MTVKELTALLQKVDPDLPVMTEGCDCTGGVGGVYIYVFKREKGDEKHAYLSRKEEIYGLKGEYESFTKVE